MNQSKEMVKLAVEALEEKKGEDVKIIDIEGVSVIADYFVLASASNANQTQALVDNVEEGRLRVPPERRQHELYMGTHGLRRCDRTRILQGRPSVL